MTFTVLNWWIIWSWIKYGSSDHGSNMDHPIMDQLWIIRSWINYGSSDHGSTMDHTSMDQTNGSSDHVSAIDHPIMDQRSWINYGSSDHGSNMDQLWIMWSWNIYGSTMDHPIMFQLWIIRSWIDQEYPIMDRTWIIRSQFPRACFEESFNFCYSISKLNPKWVAHILLYISVPQIMKPNCLSVLMPLQILRVIRIFSNQVSINCWIVLKNHSNSHSHPLKLASHASTWIAQRSRIIMTHTENRIWRDWLPPIFYTKWPHLQFSIQNGRTVDINHLWRICFKYYKTLLPIRNKRTSEEKSQVIELD